MRALAIAVLSLVALASRVAAEPLLGLTSTNQLVTFDSATPGTVSAPIAITGLQGGATETIQGIDIRPRTGGLYALGVVPGATDVLRLYYVSPETGAATLVQAQVSATSGTFYGTDFNPTVDRLRVVNTGDLNLRLNPNNGTLAGLDVALSPAGSLIDGIAYDRNFDGHLGTSGTTLYGIARSGSASLVTIGGIDQNPSPNGGAVTTIGALGVVPAPTAGIGFDISAATRTAYAVIKVGSVTGLFTVNLLTGAATLVGSLGNGSLNIRGIAVLSPSRVAFGTEGKNQAATLDPLVGVPGVVFDAFPKGTAKGVRVAVGDVTRDGTPDVLFGVGGRVPAAVKIFDGKTGGFLTQLLAYELNAKVGVQVASGDVNLDGFDDVITVPGPGAPAELRVYSGANLALLAKFFPFGADYTGGVTVAAADLNFDGTDEVLVASGKGLPPEVRVFEGLTGQSRGIVPIASTATKGLTVAAAAGIPPTIAVGAAAGSAEVIVLTGGLPSGVATFTEVARFAGYPGKGKGVRVALLDVNADGHPEIFAIPAGNDATTHVFDGATFAERQTFAPLTTKGGFVAAGR
jgi:hypothetical protein